MSQSSEDAQADAKTDLIRDFADKLVPEL